MSFTTRPSLLYRSQSMPGESAPRRPTVLRYQTGPAAIQTANAPKFLRMPSYDMSGIYKPCYPASTASKPKFTMNNLEERKNEDFLMLVLKAMSHFGASLNALEDVMLHGARSLNLKLMIVRHPNTITCYFGERTARRRTLTIRRRFIQGQLAAGLVQVQDIYLGALKRKIQFRDATAQLQQLRAAPAIRYPLHHIGIGAALAAVIALVVFNGGLADVLLAFAGVFLLGTMHYGVHKLSRLWADSLETIAFVVLSILVHDSHIYSKGLVSILPGFTFMCTAMNRKSALVNTQITLSGFVFMYAYALMHGLPLVYDIVLVVKLIAFALFIRRLLLRPSSPAPSARRVREAWCDASRA